MFEELLKGPLQYKLLQGESEGGNGNSAADGDQATTGDQSSQEGDQDGAILEIDGEKYTTEDIQRWKEDSDNKGNWQKEFTQRDQKLAADRKALEGRTPVTQEGPKATTQTQGVPKLSGAKIKEALGEDGDNFDGLANLLNEREDAIREGVATSIRSEGQQDAMVKDFIGRHPQWPEYTTDGGKVQEYLRNKPDGYPSEVAFLEVRLAEEVATREALVKEAKDKGYQLGEKDATKSMETKGKKLKLLRGEPPTGKGAETPLTGSQKE
jgi:hypothetical protein